MLLIGKPSISIRAIYTMAMLNNQRVHDQYITCIHTQKEHVIHDPG